MASGRIPTIRNLWPCPAIGQLRNSQWGLRVLQEMTARNNQDNIKLRRRPADRDPSPIPAIPPRTIFTPWAAKGCHIKLPLSGISISRPQKKHQQDDTEISKKGRSLSWREQPHHPRTQHQTRQNIRYQVRLLPSPQQGYQQQNNHA